MEPTLVIGFGNTLRGDDGLGPAVAELLRAQAAERLGAAAAADLRVIATPQLMPEHVADMDGRARVVFVDASVASAPGEIRCERLAAGDWSPEGTGHGYHPAALVAMAATVDDLRPEAHLVTVGIGHIGDFCEDFSPEVAAAIPVLLDRLTAWLRDGFPEPAGAQLRQ